MAGLDWDEAFLGPAEVELATAACERGAVLARGDLARARSFVREYGMAGSIEPDSSRCSACFDRDDRAKPEHRTT